MCFTRTHLYWKKYQLHTKIYISVFSILKIHPNKVPWVSKIVSRITSGPCLDQCLNTIGYFGNFSRICMGHLKDDIGIILGSKCNYISTPKEAHQDLDRITVG